MLIVLAFAGDSTITNDLPLACDFLGTVTPQLVFQLARYAGVPYHSAVIDQSRLILDARFTGVAA